MESERYDIQLNRVILYLRANKIKEADELLKKLPENKNEIRHFLAQVYISSKLEPEKIEELLFSKTNTIRPEFQLIGLQSYLSNLNIKSIDQFHSKVLGFVDFNKNFCSNYHFLSFFIGFYQSRHLKQKLSEFLDKFPSPNDFNNKNSLKLLANSFYYCGNYTKSSLFYQFLLDKIDAFDKETKINLINSLSHVDIKKSEELRKNC